MADSVSSRPRMSARDFQRQGYLQEVNRQFLHPLGLALGVVLDDPFDDYAFVVFDDRDDMEGVRFEPGPDPEKAEAVATALQPRAEIRQAALGYVVQPVDDVVES